MSARDYRDRIALGTRLDVALAAETEPWATPFVVVDLDAFDANAHDLVRRAGGKPVRVASKSLRVPALIRRALAHDGFSGILGFTLSEAIWLVQHDISDDVVVGYPTVDRGAIAQLTADERLASSITLMVDSHDQIDLIDTARTSDLDIRLCLDADAGLVLPGTRLGPKRSSIREVVGAAQLARHIVERPGFRLVGAMAYEGQVAGVPDAIPGQAPRSLAVRGIKRASVHQLAHRRAAIATALANFADLEFFNAGGSGSVETTVADPTVSEVAAGSGLLVPTLFDNYRAFHARPAAYFGLPVTRRPDHHTATVHGGGLIASGPTGKSRAPTPWAPPGLAITSIEGAGEVQTPLEGAGVYDLRVGDMVWFRHAKSGELFEHTNIAHLLHRDRFVEHVPTYRGVGQSW